MTKIVNRKYHMKLEKVIAISGKPGLYEIISQSKSGVIVEALDHVLITDFFPDSIFV
jgi:hypothetical protein